MATLGPTKTPDVKIKGEVNTVKAEILKNIEDGNLVIITVGDSEHLPTREDLTRVSDHMAKAFENVKGVKVLVLPHNISVQKMEIPQLRSVLNEVICAPTDSSPTYNPIIDLDIS